MAQDKKPLAVMAFGAIGVVFGDIGTSPLYAFRQVFHDQPGLVHESSAVLGILSLFLWSIILVVCVKYVGFVMRADHDGEGGTLAMLGLIHADAEPSQDQTRADAPDAAHAGEHRETPRPGPAPAPGGRGGPNALTLLALFASALLFGDGIITPAISVLSAVEGLKVATTAFEPMVLPLAIAILAALFVLQTVGTERVAKLFAPVMLAWFITIGVIGLIAMLHHPAVLAAANPLYALSFLGSHGWTGFATLGAVVLAFSGVEALFADLGQFGRRPITLAWYCVVLPGLLLNYLGQGGHVLDNPAAAAQPFFALVPHWAIYPLIVLATAAAVIASQALISGAFSLTRQAINLGYAPRYTVRHTASATAGQVYVPVINAVLAVACIGIVLAFRSSQALGNAYGLAVIGTMTITSVIYFVVLRRVWRWPRAACVAVVGSFLVIEVAFLASNLTKLLSGAWVPVVIAALLFAVLAIWTDGRARYRQAIAGWSIPVARFLHSRRRKHDTGRLAVFLTDDLAGVPMVGRIPWLMDEVRHKAVLLLKVETAEAATVADAERVQADRVDDGLYTATVRFGFMEPATVSTLLPRILPSQECSVVFYVPELFDAKRGKGLKRLCTRLFLAIGDTGLSPVQFFDLPPTQTVSVGVDPDF